MLQGPKRISGYDVAHVVSGETDRMLNQTLLRSNQLLRHPDKIVEALRQTLCGQAFAPVSGALSFGFSERKNQKRVRAGSEERLAQPVKGAVELPQRSGETPAADPIKLWAGRHADICEVWKRIPRGVREDRAEKAAALPDPALLEDKHAVIGNNVQAERIILE